MLVGFFSTCICSLEFWRNYLFDAAAVLEHIRIDQGRRRNPNPNFCFWVRISSGGVGVFHVKGWGPKSSVCASNPRETKLLGGLSRDSCRDIPGAPEKFEKKMFVFNFCSLVDLA